jgi:dihydropyrimidinase
MIVSDVNQETLKEMDLLVEEGVTSFKQFMAYPGVFYSDDGQILRAMQRAAENGGLIMMHAENGIAIDVLVEQALARGETDPRYHGEVRKALLEAEATHRAIRLAQVAGAPLYVVHVSAAEAVAELTRARDEGLNVFGETCPQYLFLSTDNLAEPDFEGAKYVCSTPLRPREHQARLWQGLRTNDLQVVSTDHCPFCFTGQKELGRGDFSKIPNGLPGVENRMDLLHQAVVDGHISRRRWIEIACATPARMFGLYPKKGTIAPGADADVVIYDPHAEQVMSAETHHMNVDYSAYEGKRVTGRVETVLSRGELVIDQREYAGHAGHGVFTPRSTCQYLN